MYKKINNTLYTCDVCGKLILDTEDAFLAWSRNKSTYKFEGFFIAHRVCFDNFHMEMELTSALHIDGLAKLIVMLEEGLVADIDSFTEVMKRLYLPHYEEARKYFPLADAEDRKSVV